MSMIYFGGDIVPAINSDLPPYTPNTDLNDPETFRFAFSEWLIQCWLYDAQVPNDAKSLAEFNLDALIPQFRAKFAAGDWKRMRPGRGATAEEFILYLQLKLRKPAALAFNNEQPRVPLGRLRHKMMLSEYQIGACVISHLAMSRDKDDPLAGAAPVMLYDGHVGHIINLRNIDDSKRLISYDETTWPNDKSFLFRGENAVGTEARYLGRPQVGQWMVSVVDFFRVFFGIPIDLDVVPIWTEWARQADQKFNERYYNLFGEEFPSNDDLDSE